MMSAPTAAFSEAAVADQLALGWASSLLRVFGRRVETRACRKTCFIMQQTYEARQRNPIKAVGSLQKS